jgi:hypothetical protein
LETIKFDRYIRQRRSKSQILNTAQRILLRCFLVDRVVQEEGLYVYKMHNIAEKHFSIGIAPVRSRGGLLVN